MRHFESLPQTALASPQRPAPSRLHLSPPEISGRELALVHEAFASNYVAPAGPMLERFEAAMAEVTGFQHCVAVSCGTAALHLALRCLDVGPGDVVIAADLTFIGGVSPIVMQGAEPVFIDIEPATWTIDPMLLHAAVVALDREGRRPKAVIPCDLYGQSADLDALRAVLEPFDIPLVADSAEAMGAGYKGRHAGKGAAMAAYSFNGNKIITSGGGGVLAADDRRWIDRARYLAQQARQPVPHYEHVELGYNYRMSNILAAIGLGQLELLPARVDKRRAIFRTYQSLLADVPGISFMPQAAYGRANCWLSCIVVDPARFGADSETIRLALDAAGIEARPLWKPMHLQPVFAGARFFGGTFGTDLFTNGLCLPSGGGMTAADQARVTDVIRAVGGWA
jgi:dTDP-4-amino-4,6-dideoxygalactose transaminase